MKRFKSLTVIALAATMIAAPFAGLAADPDQKKDEKAKPYPLKTCIVSDDKLGGDMGEPYVFAYKGQEIKLCCKSCLKAFDKDPAKYLKKMEVEAAKADAVAKARKK